jgi:hypothetical protein
MPLLVAGAIALSISSASASIVTNPGAQAISTQEILAARLQPYEVTRTAFHEFRGTCNMENGNVLRRSRDGRNFFVEVPGQAGMEVRASSPNTFIAVGGGAEITFE